MGDQGTTTIDFGAFPGKTDATVTVMGQAAIVSGSLCEGWLIPVATADHSEDEHRLAPMKVRAGPPTAGSGFPIFCVVEDNPGTGIRDLKSGAIAKDGLRLYGLYTLAWAWN